MGDTVPPVTAAKKRASTEHLVPSCCDRPAATEGIQREAAGRVGQRRWWAGRAVRARAGDESQVQHAQKRGGFWCVYINVWEGANTWRGHSL